MKIFITDGNPSTFFTAVYDAYREENCTITADTQLQIPLGGEIIRTVYDARKCGRVRRAINACDPCAEETILLALRCCDTQKERIAFEYVKKLMQLRAPVGKRLSLPEVIALNNLAYKVTGETHRLKGLLRFTESITGALYAPYSPDNDVTELLMPHFAARLSDEKFVIHDIKRRLAGMYDGKECILGYTGNTDVYLSDSERNFESLWKRYYAAVNIKERPHEKQMKGSMPVRYWKFLPEKKP